MEYRPSEFYFASRGYTMEGLTRRFNSRFYDASPKRIPSSLDRVTLAQCLMDVVERTYKVQPRMSASSDPAERQCRSPPAFLDESRAFVSLRSQHHCHVDNNSIVILDRIHILHQRVINSHKSASEHFVDEDGDVFSGEGVIAHSPHAMGTAGRSEEVQAYVLLNTGGETAAGLSSLLPLVLKCVEAFLRP